MDSATRHDDDLGIDQIHVVRQEGFYLMGKVEGQRTNLLIDTGCTVTIVSKDIFLGLSADERPELHSYPNTLLSADDSPIEVLGMATFNISIGNKVIQHPCVIAAISNDGLIGMDFLKQHKVVVDFSQHQVTIEGEVHSACCRQGQQRACRVTVAENIVLPAGTRTIVPARAKKPLADGDWIIEPLSHTPGHLPVLMAKTLVHTCGTRLMVEVLNPTEADVTLHRHTNLGIATRAAEDEFVCMSSSSSDAPSASTAHR